MRTLRHAVERGKVHHAYLFVGSRGTGKTSMAKILAASLDCEHGPTVDPCGECDSCRSIAAATSLDVIEMDAASNNSVEDIRELRESVAFAPVSGRHKVYILDEAHMLSQAAWNAFLKTLEEPPPHTVFVLATTEANKVPATVVDRCHRFDFQRPGVEQISTVLTRVAQAESIEIPPEAIAAIARAATGSFRDALGTLEQLLTYSGGRIELADVLAVLGVADEALVSGALDAVHGGDARETLLAVERCLRGGRDASSFMRDLETRARELLVVQTLGEVPAELALTPEIDVRLREQAERISSAEVVRVLDLLGAALENVRAGADPRTQLELALVKAATPSADGSLPALLARIERLEQALATGAAAAASDAAADEAPATPPDAQAVAPTVAGSAVPPAAGSAAPPVAGSAVPPAAGSAVPPVAESAAPPDAGSAAPPVAGSAVPPDALAAAPPVAGSAAASVEEPALAAVAVAAPPADLGELWAAVHETVKAEHALLGAVLNEAAPVALSEQELTLAFAPGAAFLKRKAEDPANRTILTESLRRLTGTARRVSFELSEEPADGPAAGGAAPSEEEIVARLVAELDAEELPADWLQQRREGG